MNHDYWSEAINFLQELIKASHDGADQCSEKLIELLKNYFDLKACSFYSYSEDADILSLLDGCPIILSYYSNFFVIR